MAITLDDASKIVLTRRKLYLLRAKAPSDEVQNIDAQLARLDPYQQEADDVVMAHSDEEFAKAAKALKNQIKPIDDAIADINKISKAIATAAQIITNIIKAVGAISKIVP